MPRNLLPGKKEKAIPKSYLIKKEISVAYGAIILLTNCPVVKELGVVFTLYLSDLCNLYICSSQREPWSFSCPVIYHLSGLQLRARLL